MTFQRVFTRTQELEILNAMARGVPQEHLARKYGVSRRTIYRVRERAAAEPAPVRELKPCGTVAAYRRHKRADEYPCTACLAANARDQEKYRKKSPNRKAAA